MKYTFPLAAVIALVLIAWIGSNIPGMQYLFGVVIPYLAIATFIIGFCYRVVQWAKSPVPFKIPDDLRSAVFTALDQARQAGSAGQHLPGRGQDVPGNRPLPFALAQHQGRGS